MEAIETGLLDSLNPVGSSQASFSENAQLTREEFFQIMVAELNNQDPFEPVDNKQFLEQLASLQTLDVTGRLNDAMEKLLFQQRLSSASSFIGKEVMVLDESGEKVSGRVERVRIQGESIELLLGGNFSVPIDRVLEIKGGAGADS